MTILLAIFSVIIFGQDRTVGELEALLNNKEYDKVIQQYMFTSKLYSAKALYYVGFAYFMKEDDTNCLKMMNSSIEKDPKDPAPHFIKGATLNYMDKFNEAVKCFQTAISLKPDNGEYYSGLGDSYYHLGKTELALQAYKKATEQTNSPDRPYSMIAQIYFNLKENDKALEAFYTAKSKISKQSDSYTNALFNIGLIESLKGNYDKAEPAFIEIIQLNPKDYHSYSKLIQIYYHRKEYEKARLYKDKLYEAHKNGELKESLSDMFCFDQFKWNDYLVQVFERYENENKGRIYNKHLFYVIDNAGKIVLRVQTEFAPFSVAAGGPKYVLCANKGEMHFNSALGFNDDLKYEELKAAAVRLFERYVR
jgi:tetratricopeptide (TPR) repeat protein